MIVLKFALAFYILVIGGGNRYLHRRHRRSYAPGSAWAYYTRLRRQGNWQGTFMLWSTASGIVVTLILVAMAAWHMSLSWSPLRH
jgi:hypothetical protein